MSLVENYAAERRARLERLGARPKAKPIARPVAKPIKPVNPEPFYVNMWFYHLVNYTPIEPTILDIQRACAAHYRIPLSALVNHKKIFGASLPRQVAMYLSRRLTTHSMNVIARAFYRDHATVHHGIKRIARLIESNRDLAEQVSIIRSRF
jgi:hypothetical protein